MKLRFHNLVVALMILPALAAVQAQEPAADPYQALAKWEFGQSRAAAGADRRADPQDRAGRLQDHRGQAAAGAQVAGHAEGRQALHLPLAGRGRLRRLRSRRGRTARGRRLVASGTHGAGADGQPGRRRGAARGACPRSRASCWPASSRRSACGATRRPSTRCAGWPGTAMRRSPAPRSARWAKSAPNEAVQALDGLQAARGPGPHVGPRQDHRRQPAGGSRQA